MPGKEPHHVDPQGFLPTMLDLNGRPFSVVHQEHNSSNFRRGLDGRYRRVGVYLTAVVLLTSSTSRLASSIVPPSASYLFLVRPPISLLVLSHPATDIENITTMPRKDFRNDLNQATPPQLFPHLSRVRAGDDDESILFTFTSSHMQVDFQVIISDSHDYPRDHSYFIFSTSDNVSEAVMDSLARTNFTGSSVHHMLRRIDDIVNHVIHDRDPPATAMPDDPDRQDSAEEAFEEDDEYESDEYESDADFDPSFSLPVHDKTELRTTLRRDLQAAKAAGFRVGCLDDITGCVIVSVSCRIAHLGLSEEVMQTWDVHPSEYLVMLIRYPSRYMNLKRILDDGANAKSYVVQIHVGLCNSYKPSLEHARKACQATTTTGHEGPQTNSKKVSHGIRSLFIGGALNSLLNDRFLDIVRLRLKYGYSWTGAEVSFQRSQGKILDDTNTASDEDYEEETWAASAPTFLAADHMVDADPDGSRLSLPLLAMQFALRHFVKCTEFCLVCHCKTRDNFEALKPYVCSNGLCLYQYMTLGMGPNLEHEVRSQPYVVDMLVSLTYARASSGRLRDFPTGLGLRVPVSDCIRIQFSNLIATLENQSPPAGQYTARFHAAQMELLPDKKVPLRIGDWIAVIFPAAKTEGDAAAIWHGRVERLGESSPHIYLSSPSSPGVQLSPKELSHRSAGESVFFFVYDQNFDDLNPCEKQKTMQIVLDTLPDVDQMKAFLGPYSNGRLLSSWTGVISPAALGLLRWIVASNRSYIMQDNDRPEHLVSGMDGFVQFRLAQGAPDKEQRFIDAVDTVSLTANPQYPTLFAWHGSPLFNWHSILREGLNFDTVANGRACGDGVYLSRDFNTSIGYCQRHGPGGMWPGSKLKIHAAISLNEVVNAPQKFRCTNPHYVVNFLDWIQPRYLFVKCRAESGLQAAPTQVYKQDPKYQAMDPARRAVVIPLSILGKRGQPSHLASLAKNAKTKRSSPDRTGRKRRKPSSSNQSSTLNVDGRLDDDTSVATASDDERIFLSEIEDCTTESDPRTGSNLDVHPAQDQSLKTDFVPGTLKGESLSLLSMPEYATSSATKVLQQHFQATLKVQQREPLHELGWYVDPNLISTVYQWIVELHSFDPALPLAEDLKALGLKSIVLELRFPPQFPMAPPFARVIRPRFRGFAAGGGGHVTAGGAMCMELLTDSGWLPTASIESVLLQVRMAMTNLEPFPARLAPSPQQDYKVGEAIEAYQRACLRHGWRVPEGIRRLSWA
ncbi:hypothetical protein N7510_008196 [Penicillium lagena]|uniref:uncharacterized protein n=1 Tax=Penicillium lagena TaxID=94218 RepID=UPI0025414EDE|nr:uncharacterized protein N7510_008196 [Penicillium lagena]KAJ5605415.1 hypothetical protein N7510_008196 [Penicillium lagena]